ncbi:MAG TPA: CPBP family intramembrane glutamic endopeptidase [Thermoanaerobaculia bacterium]|jgi:membrane protease YdiL (CAAX protease family)|nr:CPBP family intramembrane glutamic endopeptidase [Thermoanaerobaculia bacterium]
MDTQTFPSSWRSVIIFTAVLAVIAIAASSATHAAEVNRMRVYVSAMAAEWGAIYYIWHVCRSRGSSIQVLIGGTWSTRAVAIDVLIAAAFWIVVRLVLLGVHSLLNDTAANVTNQLLPRTTIESIVWIFVSITAGICEELMFRGFLQRQILTLTGSAILAIVAQAIIFGATHAYQGWRSVVAIIVYGLLAGILAHWRRNLRPGVVAHAWQDIAGGLLRL